MDMLTRAMVLSGLFFGWTIGSHCAGSTVGMAYGSGIIKSPTSATIPIALSAFLGATVESGNGVASVGTGINREEDMTPSRVRLAIEKEAGSAAERISDSMSPPTVAVPAIGD